MQEILFCPQKDFMSGALFDLKNEALNRDGTLRQYYEMKKALEKNGLEVKTIDQSADISKAKAIFFLDMPKPENEYYRFCLKNRLGKICNLVLYEPPATRPDNYDEKNHEFFAHVLTWKDDLVDGKKYLKNNFCMPFLVGEKISMRREPFDKKKLLCLVSANKYSTHPNQLYTERVHAIRFMQKNHPAEFDLYGQRWDLPVFHSDWAEKTGLNNFGKLLNKLGSRSPTKLFPKWRYSSYAGGVRDKFEVMAQYKFSICYENQKEIDGYVSEKMLDAFISGNVPVYLGARNIEQHVPKECFVDKRDFQTYEELYARLSGMSEKEYDARLNAIEKFLNSKMSEPYRIDFFVQAIKRASGI